MILEGEFPVKVKSQPPDVFWWFDGDNGSFKDGCEMGGGVVVFSPREVHEVGFLGVDVHADVIEVFLGLEEGGSKSDYVLFQGV